MPSAVAASEASPKTSWVQRLYTKALNEADQPRCRRLMYLISFAESSFFPLPPDLMIIPMILSNRTMAWRLAFWATFWSVAGGLLGYGIGALFIGWGEWIIKTYHLEAGLSRFQEQFREWGFWIIVLKGFTPVPFKLVTIAGGMAKLNLPKFIAASVIARAFRFYLLSWLLWQFGPAAREWIERYLTLALGVVLGVIAIGFVLVKAITG